MKKAFYTDSSPSPFKRDDGTFYKVVRLKTGEAILCSMNDDINSLAAVSHLTLINPVLATATSQLTKDHSVFGESFMLRPWIGLSDSKEFVIGTDIVLTIGNLYELVREQYDVYLVEREKAEKFFEVQRKEEEKKKNDEEVNVAIFNLLTEVNEGRKVYILRDNPKDVE